MEETKLLEQPRDGEDSNPLVDISYTPPKEAMGLYWSNAE